MTSRQRGDRQRTGPGGWVGTPRRPRRPARPTLETLEGRALLATSALDPTFGAGGVALGGAIPDLSNTLMVDATAVQPDGKVVVVESMYGAIGEVMTVLRYDADGSVDSTFGTAGQVSIPTPGVYNSVGPTGNVAIAPDGDIYFAASIDQDLPLASSDEATAAPAASIVVRLTPAGKLDAGYGTGGEAVIGAAGIDFRYLALQADGKVVVAGDSAQRFDDATQTYLPAVSVVSLARLTTAGTTDATFNGTGERDITVPTTPATPDGYTVAGLAIAPNGQIVVAGSGMGIDALPSSALVARVDADGSADPTFGTGGVMPIVTADDFDDPTALAVQSTGAIILAGFRVAGPGDFAGTLIRLKLDGTVDPTFRSPVVAAGTYDGYSQVVVGPDDAITVGGSTEIGATGVNLGLESEFLVERFLADGAPDPSFGRGGRSAFSLDLSPVAASVPTQVQEQVQGLALTPTGQVIIAAIARTYDTAPNTDASGGDVAQLVVARLLPIATTRPVAGDYDGDGETDIAADLAAFGAFAYRASGGTGDAVAPFGPIGVGQVIPAPGDYDGDGKTDLAAYLPNLGVFIDRPSSGGADVVVPFGTAGVGNSIPAPGDYDGDGKTDFAVYLPASGTFAYRPSHGGPDVLVPFGTPGAGMSIPAPGDYDGDGVTDIAVYLPTYGVLAYRPSSGDADVLTPFGIPGAGATIPAPGDYDGDGKADIAAYLPSLGIYAYRPSSGGADVLESFGLAGAGASIPAPGDYDGDGKTDMAVYLPSFGLMASRPSGGGADVVTQFGLAGTGQTVPAASISPARATTAAATEAATSSAMAIALPPTDETADPGATPAGRRRSRVGLI